MSQTNGCATGKSYKFIYTRKRELSFIKIASKIPYIVNDVCMFVGGFFPSNGKIFLAFFPLSYLNGILMEIESGTNDKITL